MLTAVVIIIAVGVTVAALARLFQPAIRESDHWRATVTPLASIIGSGFLVVSPLLREVAGAWAPVAVGAVCAFAYAVGETIRFTITAAADEDLPAVADRLERPARTLLGLAYVISVAFYLRLLASFVLSPFPGEHETLARVITSALLVVIGLVGWRRGLDGLELLEEYAVNVKLAIVAGVVAGVVVYNGAHLPDAVTAYGAGPSATFGWLTVRRLAGMLLVVQGFETSKYLGAKYDAATRVRTMRAAQLASSAIYVAFVAVAVPLFPYFPARIDETAIIDGLRVVAAPFAAALIVAAVMSQLSAAVADTAGGGGMLTDSSDRSLKAGYVAVVFGAAVVVWVADVFSIIAVASRAFAAYYFCQAVAATITARRRGDWARTLGFGVVALVLAAIAVGAASA